MWASGRTRTLPHFHSSPQWLRTRVPYHLKASGQGSGARGREKEEWGLAFNGARQGLAYRKAAAPGDVKKTTPSNFPALWAGYVTLEVRFQWFQKKPFLKCKYTDSSKVSVGIFSPYKRRDPQCRDKWCGLTRDTGSMGVLQGHGRPPKEGSGGVGREDPKILL